MTVIKLDLRSRFVYILLENSLRAEKLYLTSLIYPLNVLFQNKMSYVGLSQHIDFNHLPVPTDRFELQHLIGEGTYGEVFSARDKVSGKRVAVKVSSILSYP